MVKTKLSSKSKGISAPLVNDILLGRGGSSIHNDSNVRYRAMVREYKKEYQTYTRHQKTQLAERLVEEWLQQDPPGRFLEKDEKTGLWHAIPEKSARRKTSQLLREGAPKIRRQLKDESVLKKQQQQQESQAAQASFHNHDGQSPPPPSLNPGGTLATVTAEVSPERSYEENHATMVPATPVRSEERRTSAGPLSTNRPFFDYPRSSYSYGAHPGYQYSSYAPYPRTPPHSQSHFVSPPRWQPYPYHASNPAPVPATPAPTTTMVPRTPKTTTTSTVTAATPLKPITPADVNQKPPTIKNRTSSSGHNNHNNIFLHKPPTISRNTSNSSTGSKSNNYYHRTSTHLKPASPESVLEFFDLGELPPPSWDCSDICGDVSSLVEDLKSSEEEEEGHNNNSNKCTSFLWERTPLPLEPLSENEEICPDLPSNVPMSPIRTQNREDSMSSQPRQSSYLSDASSFSFSSYEDVALSLPSGERSSFDMMEKVIRAESDIDHTSTIDILNELDKEMEAEMMLTLCPSL